MCIYTESIIQDDDDTTMMMMPREKCRFLTFYIGIQLLSSSFPSQQESSLLSAAKLQSRFLSIMRFAWLPTEEISFSFGKAKEHKKRFHSVKIRIQNLGFTFRLLLEFTNTFAKNTISKQTDNRIPILLPIVMRSPAFGSSLCRAAWYSSYLQSANLCYNKSFCCSSCLYSFDLTFFSQSFSFCCKAFGKLLNAPTVSNDDFPLTFFYQRTLSFKLHSVCSNTCLFRTWKF